VILAAVPIAAPAIIVIVAAVEEENAAPEPAMPAEIAIPVSEARETAAAVYGEIAAAYGVAATAHPAGTAAPYGVIAAPCGEVAAARGARADAAMTAASLRAAGKDERGIAVRSRCSEERTCRYGQAKS
jgi:hypothetical protein